MSSNLSSILGHHRTLLTFYPVQPLRYNPHRYYTCWMCLRQRYLPQSLNSQDSKYPHTTRDRRHKYAERRDGGGSTRDTAVLPPPPAGVSALPPHHRRRCHLWCFFTSTPFRHPTSYISATTLYEWIFLVMSHQYKTSVCRDEEK